MPSNDGRSLEAVLDVSSSLASAVGLDEVFANVARTIGETMMVAEVEVHSYDQRQNAFIREAVWTPFGDEVGGGADAEELGSAIPAAERPDLQQVLAHPGPLELSSDDPGLPATERERLSAAARAAVLEVPLSVGREVLGVLTLADPQHSRRFAPADKELVLRLSSLAAMAIRNAYLVRERDERTRHSALLLNVSHAIMSSLVLDDVLAAICHLTGEALAVASCDIQLYRPEEDRLLYAAVWDRAPVEGSTYLGTLVDPDERPSNRLVVEGRTVECHADDPDLPAGERAGLEFWGEKSTLDVPLVFGGEVIGILGIVETERIRRFTYEERALLEQLALLASIAIHNAQAFRELEEKGGSGGSGREGGRRPEPHQGP